MITFGSLFAGIGGFDLGFERAGMVCRWQVEKDSFCQKILNKHWPEVGKWDDVKTFPPSPINDWEVDVICGGDPCQGNSRANYVHNTRHEDLGSHFIRVIDAIRPRIVVRENPADTKHDADWSGKRMQNSLEQIGYAILPVKFAANQVGRDHRRNRLFLIGERADPYRIGLSRFDWQGFKDGNICRVDRNKLLQVTQPKDLRTSPNRCGVCDGVPRRVDRIRSLGNSVVPQITEIIGRIIVNAMESISDAHPTM